MKPADMDETRKSRSRMTKSDELLTAMEAACGGAEVVRRIASQSLAIRHKEGSFDVVTDADIQAEEAIVGLLRSRFPSDAILGEEGDYEQHKSGRLWLVDPIDGTGSFMHRYPYYCVSVALVEDEAVVVGVVFNPLTNELFYAQKGSGAYLNHIGIHVSSIAELSQCLFSTGFAHERGERMRSNVRRIGGLLGIAQDMRRGGSAALDLCYVACGRLSFYFEEGLQSYDIAAGKLIVEEAGGRVTNYGGERMGVTRPSPILASNGLIHDQVVNAFER